MHFSQFVWLISIHDNFFLFFFSVCSCEKTVTIGLLLIFVLGRGMSVFIGLPAQTIDSWVTNTLLAHAY